jgi:hypothetical protein
MKCEGFVPRLQGPEKRIAADANICLSYRSAANIYAYSKTGVCMQLPTGKGKKDRKTINRGREYVCVLRSDRKDPSKAN